ncbi:hypothetical protein BDF20DRAFT_236572 [Mycotypha africana]|uniref:uncharacterized protein n=1 Tax=Mycotypha africana TaxID=64632 RepID=UPI002300F008|nr:uncharacterized protein BDF20DRAFT_236572 [Mycotypha africana]KAI8967461.1 hypothetical protein BDF20DRAFT_236572 [Mycotypha africana]
MPGQGDRQALTDVEEGSDIPNDAETTDPSSLEEHIKEASYKKMSKTNQVQEEAESNTLEEEEEEDPNTVLKERQLYESLADLKEAAIRYARKRKFAVVTLRSGERQLVMTCKHSGTYRAATKKKSDEIEDTETEAAEYQEDDGDDSSSGGKRSRSADTADSIANKRKRLRLSQKIKCPFQIRAKPASDGQWIVYTINDIHNHEMASDIKAYSQHRKVSDDVRRRILELYRMGASAKMISHYLEELGITNVFTKDISNIRTNYLRKRKRKLEALEKVKIEEGTNEDINNTTASQCLDAQNSLGEPYEDLEPLDNDIVIELHEFYQRYVKKPSKKS